MWSIASHEHPDIPANHPDSKGKGTIMKKEEETEHPREKEEIHPREKETAETAAAQGSVTTATK